MDTKTNWKRVGLVAGVLVMGLAGARYGRIMGHAAGDDGASGGCGAPTAVGADGATVAAQEQPTPRKTETRAEERRKHKAQMYRLLHHRERPAHHVAAPAAPRTP